MLEIKHTSNCSTLGKQIHFSTFGSVVAKLIQGKALTGKPVYTVTSN
jgi:hypothetical protein